MSASDQEEVTETPESRPESKREPKPEPEAESGTDTSAGDPDTRSETAPESEPTSGPTSGPDTEPESGPDTGVGDPADAGHDDTALTPRQARRIRVTVASVLLVAMAALLAVRLANRSSVLVVGVYGLAMILCGVVIELSRHGRTRLATWVLGVGLAATLATDWLLLP
ncbi:hypothetical protein OIE71_09010 [Streptomyces sp. NBC_01725]|uniref:hypothetical protein n=1 Tax=Streptomyces sp. NBC_01725 TaxID=2975923 RepID=UPI002E2D2D40|nr:hypothetical protein [Streptomyces sp. NBC_01725]